MIANKLATLEMLLQKDQDLYQIIEVVSAMGLPEVYIAGGCISQTVWNYLFQMPCGYGISDVDIVYFSEDLRETSEARVIEMIQQACGHLRYPIDVKNEARVHLWYEERFGKQIPPYTSTKDAISSWPTTATCAGVHLKEGQLECYTTFGYEDIFKGILRPNKRLITAAIYEAKVQKWPQLTVIPW